MGKATPKRCPNCGSTNIHIQELESPHDLAELYDVFCRDCKWSGDISPDSPLESRNINAPALASDNVRQERQNSNH